MNLLDWFGGGASPRRKPWFGRDTIYVPDPLGRLGRGSWRQAGDLPDPFGRLVRREPENRLPTTWDDDEISVIKAVGPRDANRPEDVGRIERFLGTTGHLDLNATEGPTGWYGQRLDHAIRDYQKNRGLKVDGVIKPGGETIRSLSELFGQSPGTAGGNRQNQWDRFWGSRTAPKVGAETEDDTPRPQNMFLTRQDLAEDPRKSQMPMLHRPGYVWEDGDWRLETPEERRRPKILPLAAGERAAETQPGSTDKPTTKPLSDKAVRELAGDLYQAAKSGDGKRYDAARNALDFYPEADRKRIEAAARSLSSGENRGNSGVVSVPIAPRPSDPIKPEDLTAEEIFDALKVPSDPEEFARGDWRDRQDNVMESLAELRKTDPEKFERIQKDLQEVHADRDDWHARWGYPESKLPPETRDSLLREASRYRHMSDQEQHEFFRRLRSHQGTDPEFYDFVKDEINSEAIGEDIIAGPKFFTGKELRERIRNRENAGLSATAINVILSNLYPPAKPLAQALDTAVNALATISGMAAKEELKRRKRYRRNK